MLVVLTDLVSSAILYTIEYDAQYQGFNVVEQEVSLDEMGVVVAQFLAETAVPDASFRPIEARQNPAIFLFSRSRGPS